MNASERIKGFIKSNEKLNFLRVCIQQGLTKEGREQVVGVKVDSRNMVLHHFGEENHGKIVYVIDPVNSYSSGFFSDFNTLLQLLYVADMYGFAPVVKCSENSIYFEDDEQHFKTRNFFEYFFEQPVGINLGSVTQSAAVVFGEGKHRRFMTELPEEKRDVMCVEMLKKYIRLNAPTRKLLDDATKQMLQGKKTLGVKYRGTDYFRGFKNHPIPCTPDEVIEKTRTIFAQGKYDQIFLATEDFEAFVAFKKAFGDRLCFFQDVDRYEKEKNAIISIGNSKEQYPRYRAGLEVLRDTWVLAHTDGLVGTRAGVTIYAVLFNEAYAPQKYKEKYVIDHGLFTKGPDSIKFNEKIIVLNS